MICFLTVQDDAIFIALPCCEKDLQISSHKSALRDPQLWVQSHQIHIIIISLSSVMSMPTATQGCASLCQLITIQGRCFPCQITMWEGLDLVPFCLLAYLFVCLFFCVFFFRHNYIFQTPLLSEGLNHCQRNKKMVNFQLFYSRHATLQRSVQTEQTNSQNVCIKCSIMFCCMWSFWLGFIDLTLDLANFPCSTNFDYIIKCHRCAL